MAIYRRLIYRRLIYPRLIYRRFIYRRFIYRRFIYRRFIYRPSTYRHCFEIRHQGDDMPTITTTDGTEIYYKEWGTGQPVVFSHGWPLSADAWEDQMLFLAGNGYRCITRSARPRPLGAAMGWQRHGHLR